jgi:signal transduction histidine kinase
VEARLVSEEDVELSPRLQDALYRISLEALNNVLKHSRATEVQVELRVADSEVVLEVVDNGAGFDPSAIRVAGGMGLATMRERAEEVGGKLTVDSQPGRGTRIILRIPMHPAD